MPLTTLTIKVEGTTTSGPSGPLLILSQRLEGHDTFLTGTLSLGDQQVPVRIMTFDDATTLQPTAPANVPPHGGHWTGALHLPHGLRSKAVPADLQQAADTARRDLGALDAAELRYALTYLEEAATPAIRSARIEAIVTPLPAKGATKE